jgi:hypothetical protein
MNSPGAFEGASTKNVRRKLWITLASSGEKGFIVGSCHTFPGRFLVWFDNDQRARCVSKAELADASQEAEWWIDGFLHGSVPLAPEDASSEAEWWGNRASFLRTGYWPTSEASA